MKQNITENILSNEELKALRPKERGRYVESLILNVVNEKRDFTISELIAKTGLARVTLMKHLDNLVLQQQILKQERGLGRITIGFYKKAGSVAKKEEFRSTSDPSIAYSFFVLDNDDQRQICIQQKEEDEYRNFKVKGAITISFDDLRSFITEINTYGARVIHK